MDPCNFLIERDYREESRGHYQRSDGHPVPFSSTYLALSRSCQDNGWHTTLWGWKSISEAGSTGANEDSSVRKAEAKSALILSQGSSLQWSLDNIYPCWHVGWIVMSRNKDERLYSFIYLFMNQSTCYASTFTISRLKYIIIGAFQWEESW